jgi:uncharacterized membrane protein
MMIFKNNFRVRLYQEARVWQNEGVITSTQFQQLAKKYDFNQLEASASVNFVLILVALGSILIGFGAITFISANWQIWAREIKVSLLLTILFTTNIIGFYLWQHSAIATLNRDIPQPRKQILGQGLLILGALVLGVNVAIVWQIFHIDSSIYELFLAWGVCVAIMAYSLRLTSLAILSLILVQLGYFTGLSELPYLSSDTNLARLAVEYMPLSLWFGFIPLAYWCQSRLIFGLSVLAFIISLQLNLNPFAYLNSANQFFIASVAFALPPALIFSHNHSRCFQPLARSLTLLYFCILFYIFSFRWYWYPSNLSLISVVDIPGATSINLTLLSIIAAMQWFLTLKSQPNHQPHRFNWITLIVFTWIGIALSIPLLRYLNDEISAVAFFNAIFAIFACSLIRQALEYRNRWIFWAGIMLLTLQILSRTLEYNIPLLWKSLTFTLVGIIIILAGLWFERQQISDYSSNHPS